MFGLYIYSKQQLDFDFYLYLYKNDFDFYLYVYKNDFDVINYCIIISDKTI